MRSHPLLWFYLLAFIISWLGWLPVAAGSHGISPFDQPAFQALLLLPAVGPAAAAGIVVWSNEGSQAARRLFGALFRWWAGRRWLAVVILLPALVHLGSHVVTRVPGFQSAAQAPGGAAVAVVAFVVALVSNPWEEVGWRGFALPRLQQRYSALTASLMVGVLWALWHLPLFLWADNPMSRYPFVPWLIGVLADSVIYTWLFNSTRGSLSAVALFHILTNAYGPILPRGTVVSTAIVACFVAAILIGLYGRDHLARGERVVAM